MSQRYVNGEPVHAVVLVDGVSGQPASIGADLDSIAGMGIPPHDHITLGYTGGNLTTVTYRQGGAGGAVVATLTLGYTSGVLTTVARS